MPRSGLPGSSIVGAHPCGRPVTIASLLALPAPERMNWNQCTQPPPLRKVKALACHHPQIIKSTPCFAGTGTGIDIGVLICGVPHHDSTGTSWYGVRSGAV